MTLGPELAVNGSFDGNATGWTLPLGWTYNSGHIFHRADILGPDLVTNGTFTGNANGWTVGSNWLYSANTITYPLSQAGGLSNWVYQDLGSGNIEVGATYRISVDVLSITPHTTGVFIGLFASLAGGNLHEITAPGSYTFTMVAEGPFLILDSAGADNIVMDNIVVQKYDQTGSARALQNIDLLIGKTYLLTCEVTTSSAFGVDVNLGNETKNCLNGTYSLEWTSDEEGSIEISFSPLEGGNYEITVDNVSVKEILSASSRYVQNVFMVASDPEGDVQMLNVGKDDDSAPIYYELETQALELGNPFHKKRISDKLIIFSKNAGDGKVQIKADKQDYQDVEINLDKRVNKSKPVNIEGNDLALKWFGNSNDKSPILEGLYIENVNDIGTGK